MHYDVPIWMNIPNTILNCWRGYSIKSIGNSLGKYIDNYDPKYPIFTCAHIYGNKSRKSLLEAIVLYMDGWNHLQKLDYEHIQFNCRVCHQYGNILKKYPKTIVIKGKP